MEHVMLEGYEIHGFRTMEELDLKSVYEEARSRWLRPNEIHAILYNHVNFPVRVKPVNLPKSGEIYLFDRKKLRNFRKDGHHWKKKNDGKTVKEAHEHLKVGNEERIHVYYAHGHDRPSFVRRCYWLLDKSIENIVLVHYRETDEFLNSPDAPLNSNSGSGLSELDLSFLMYGDTSSGSHQLNNAGQLKDSDSMEKVTGVNVEERIHEINTLDWEDLLVDNNPNIPIAHDEAKCGGFEQHHPFMTSDSNDARTAQPMNSATQQSSDCTSACPEARGDSINGNILRNPHCHTMRHQVMTEVTTNSSMTPSGCQSFSISPDIGMHDQDRRCINSSIMVDSPGSVNDSTHESSIFSAQNSLVSSTVDPLQGEDRNQIFTLTDVTPESTFASEETKILMTGYFHQDVGNLQNSTLYCVCGSSFVPVETVQAGVFRCILPPQPPGCVDLYLSTESLQPISQRRTLEFRPTVEIRQNVSSDNSSNWDKFLIKMRLVHLLFATSKNPILSSKGSEELVDEGKEFIEKTSHTVSSWELLKQSVDKNKLSLHQAEEFLFEEAIRNRLQDWLFERIIDGRRIVDFDEQGLGVLHLCAILNYTWAVYLYSMSGLSLNFRDKYGWTALHWAAYYGRENMVGALLSAGARPNLVTDPTTVTPGGCTASDLASQRGHNGLAAYLAEKALVDHFNEMSIAGNARGVLKPQTTDFEQHEALNYEESCLKDTLTAYRIAADAAGRINAAFREQSLKLKTEAVQCSNPEDEARIIVSAMKIQHAFRNFKTKKKMSAALRIQYGFRSWKTRRAFLKMRQHAIKIQAVFRGFQVRRQYHKIIWSVGILEKAVIRWRLKRRGLRGLQVAPVPETTATTDQQHDNNVEEDFFKLSRKQAEDRIERSVVKVQAMFRSKQAQQEYHRMKLVHKQAKLDYDRFFDHNVQMQG